MLLFSTAGRGTEKFAEKEIKSKFNCDNIRTVDGKIFFNICEPCNLRSVLNLKSVERIFIEVNCFKTSRLPYGKGKSQFLNAVKRRLVKKEKFFKTYEIFRKFYNEEDRGEYTEPKRKKVKLGEDMQLKECSFRASCKVTGRFTRLISSQELNIELGKYISKEIGWRVDLSNPEVEISIHINDELVVAGIPITSCPVSKRSYILNPGLRSTIAWIMADLTQIQAGDIVLDPMCGKGTILIEAVKSLQSKAVYIGCDQDSEQLNIATKNKEHAGLNQSIHLIIGNSRDLPFKNESIDRIMCDAPFGLKYTTTTDIYIFYRKLIQDLTRVLKVGGRMVLLTSSELRDHVLQHLHEKLQNKPIIEKSNEPSVRTCVTDITHISKKSLKSEYASSNLKLEERDQVVSIESNNHEQHTESICESLNKCETEGNSLCEDMSVHGKDEGGLKYVEDHYVKLGETHAYIIVAVKV